nr:YfbU family protein [Salinicoccus luteus]
MLLNQFKIMSLLDSANRESYCYYMDILTEGIQNKYPHVTEMISRDEVTMDVSGEVDLILEIFNKVERSMGQLSEEVQDELSAGYHVHFNGFDSGSNVEHHHFTYCNFLNRHGEIDIQKREGNTYNLSLHHYRQMILNHKSYEYMDLLSVDEIRGVCIEKGQEMEMLRPKNLNITDVGGLNTLQVVKESCLGVKE